MCLCECELLCWKPSKCTFFYLRMLINLVWLFHYHSLFVLLLPFHWTFHHWYAQVMFCLLSLGFKHLLECRDSIRSGGLVEAPHVLIHLREALFHIVLSTAFSNCAKAKPQRRVMELEKSNEKWTYVWKSFENIIPSFTQKRNVKRTMVLL